MATVTKPMALDESIKTTESTSRNIADVLAQELSGIANAITGGSDKANKTDIATVEPTNTASRAYSVGELVYVNGNLYKVITAIASGATFTVGTNIQSTNVSGTVKDALDKRKPILKSTLTGTTNSNGLLALNDLSIIVLTAREVTSGNNHRIVLVGGYNAGTQNIFKVCNTSDMSPLANTSVTIDYWYINRG